MSAIFTPASSYREEAIADGYKYECSCGELFNCTSAALSCRKCRNYCVFGYCTHVVDITTNKIVAGIAPTHDEYEAARVRAEATWAKEKAQLDFNTQMWLKEGELYEAEMERQAREAASTADRARLDRLWAIQDYLMGVK